MTEPGGRRRTKVAGVGGDFEIGIRLEDSLHVVAMSGDLDFTNRATALDACTSIDHLNVVIDLSGLAFMDCAGYGALAAATHVLEGRGGSVVLAHPVGQPLRLLTLIEEVESALCAPLQREMDHASGTAGP